MYYKRGVSACYLGVKVGDLLTPKRNEQTQQRAGAFSLFDLEIHLFPTIGKSIVHSPLSQKNDCGPLSCSFDLALFVAHFSLGILSFCLQLGLTCPALP